MSLSRIVILLSVMFMACLPSLLRAQPTLRDPLDDTFGIVNLDPDSSLVLACTQMTVTLDVSLTDARVFDLHLIYDPVRLQLISAVAGTEPTLHVLPVNVVGNQITVDAFLHPNFTGTTNVLTFTFYVNPTIGDDTTVVSFDYGQGYSGTEDSPVPIQFSGDSAIIYIEGTLPLPPSELLISRLAYPAHDDSILLRWHPVFYDFDGDTLINQIYIIYREDIKNTPYVYDSVGATSDTFFYDDFLNFTFSPGDTGVVNAATFKVHTRKTQP